MSEVTTARDPQRIAIFTFSYAPLMTGISSLVHDRVMYLLRQGHSVYLLSPSAESVGISAGDRSHLEEANAFANFTHHSFPSAPNPLRRSWPEAASYRKWSDTELLEGIRPDVVMVDEAAGLYGASSCLIGGYRRPVGVEYANREQIPVVNIIHGDWRSYAEHQVGRPVVNLAWPVVRRIMKKFATAYDLNISPSEYLRNRYDDFYLGNIEHVYTHGVNCDDFQPSNIQFDPHAADTRPVILSSGRIAVEKNLGQLLKAFRSVHSQRKDVRLVILGRGPQLKSLRKQAARQFGDAVSLPGAVFGDEIKGWYAKASVYWTASTTENFSMSILEALASGTPVVTVAAGGNVEQVQHGQSGFHCDPASPQEMAERTLELLNDESLLNAHAKRARQRALEFENGRCIDLLMKRIEQADVGRGGREIRRAA